MEAALKGFKSLPTLFIKQKNLNDTPWYTFCDKGVHVNPERIFGISMKWFV